MLPNEVTVENAAVCAAYEEVVHEEAVHEEVAHEGPTRPTQWFRDDDDVMQE